LTTPFTTPSDTPLQVGGATKGKENATRFGAEWLALQEHFLRTLPNEDGQFYTRCSSG